MATQLAENKLANDLFNRTLRDRGFSDEQIAVIRSVLDEVCVHCLDEPSENSTCWRDE